MGNVYDMKKYREAREEEEEKGLQIIVGTDEDSTCVMLAICEPDDDEAVVLGLDPAAAIELAEEIVRMANSLHN